MEPMVVFGAPEMSEPGRVNDGSAQSLKALDTGKSSAANMRFMQIPPGYWN
jgi:hypothetical protein